MFLIEVWHEITEISGKYWRISSLTLSSRFVESAKALYKGEGHGIKKYSGKILLGAAAFSTVAGVINALNVNKSYTNPNDVIDKNDRYITD